VPAASSILDASASACSALLFDLYTLLGAPLSLHYALADLHLVVELLI
jgi:hypothetical protein